MSCCNICLPDIISCLSAGDELTLNIGGLIHEETYLAVFETNQGKAYVVPFAYNGLTKTGVIPIGNSDNQLPPAVLNPNIGELELTIQDTLGHCKEFNFYIKTKCLTLSVVNYISGAYAKDQVGLPIVDVDLDLGATTIEFTNETGLVIPYTLEMQANYGNVPTVKAWILTAPGVYTETVILVTLDGNPTTTITLDFGSSATGFVKIS